MRPKAARVSAEPAPASAATPASTATGFDLPAAQQFLRDQKLDGWLLEDFHNNNPIFWQVVGGTRHSTRRAFLLIPPDGQPTFLIHFVDANRFADPGWRLDTYVNRDEFADKLGTLLGNR